MRQVPRSPLSFKLQRVANVPEHPPPSTRLMSCAHIANRRLSRIIGASSLLKKLARAKGVVIHFPGVILREGEDARTVPGSGRPFLVHPAGGADSGGSSAARDTQARSRGLEGAEP